MGDDHGSFERFVETLVAVMPDQRLGRHHRRPVLAERFRTSSHRLPRRGQPPEEPRTEDQGWQASGKLGVRVW